MLLAANFAEGTLDAYGTNLTLLGQFVDPKAPHDYAPFNVEVIDGHVFVTFAKQDDDKEDDVPGKGHGLIDVFDAASGKFLRFATGSDCFGGYGCGTNSTPRRQMLARRSNWVGWAFRPLADRNRPR